MPMHGWQCMHLADGRARETAGAWEGGTHVLFVRCSLPAPDKSKMTEKGASSTATGKLFWEEIILFLRARACELEVADVKTGRKRRSTNCQRGFEHV